MITPQELVISPFEMGGLPTTMIISIYFTYQNVVLVNEVHRKPKKTPGNLAQKRLIHSCFDVDFPICFMALEYLPTLTLQMTQFCR